MRIEKIVLVFVSGFAFSALGDMGMGTQTPMPKSKSSLEKALDSKHQGPNSPTQAPMAQGSMMSEDMMAHMGKMGQMMMGMSKMGGANAPQDSGSELPGFPGQSHLYHVGATGFFLDHETMLGFSPEQKKALEKIKERNASEDRELAKTVQQLEEELWNLTGIDRPNFKNIETKVSEIEAAKKKRRLSFIKAVGEAASLLSSDQRDLVLGKKSGASRDKASPPDSKTMSPPSGMSGMGDM